VKLARLLQANGVLNAEALARAVGAEFQTRLFAYSDQLNGPSEHEMPLSIDMAAGGGVFMPTRSALLCESSLDDNTRYLQIELNLAGSGIPESRFVLVYRRSE
jgi:hypothetical protein